MMQPLTAQQCLIGCDIDFTTWGLLKFLEDIGGCFVGPLKRLAMLVNLKPREVQRCVRKLKRRGFVSTERYGRGYRYDVVSQTSSSGQDVTHPFSSFLAGRPEAPKVREPQPEAPKVREPQPSPQVVPVMTLADLRSDTETTAPVTHTPVSKPVHRARQATSDRVHPEEVVVSTSGSQESPESQERSQESPQSQESEVLSAELAATSSKRHTVSEELTSPTLKASAPVAAQSTQKHLEDAPPSLQEDRPSAHAEATHLQTPAPDGAGESFEEAQKPLSVQREETPDPSSAEAVQETLPLSSAGSPRARSSASSPRLEPPMSSPAMPMVDPFTQEEKIRAWDRFWTTLGQQTKDLRNQRMRAQLELVHRTYHPSQLDPVFVQELAQYSQSEEGEAIGVMPFFLSRTIRDDGVDGWSLLSREVSVAFLQPSLHEEPEMVEVSAPQAARSVRKKKPTRPKKAETSSRASTPPSDAQDTRRQIFRKNWSAFLEEMFVGCADAARLDEGRDMVEASMRRFGALAPNVMKVLSQLEQLDPNELTPQIWSSITQKRTALQRLLLFCDAFEWEGDRLFIRPGFRKR